MKINVYINVMYIYSCILFIVLFSVFLTINVGIATYFIYYKYTSRNKENVSKYDYVYQTTIYLVNL